MSKLESFCMPNESAGDSIAKPSTLREINAKLTRGDQRKKATQCIVSGNNRMHRGGRVRWDLKRDRWIQNQRNWIWGCPLSFRKSSETFYARLSKVARLFFTLNASSNGSEQLFIVAGMVRSNAEHDWLDQWRRLLSSSGRIYLISSAWIIRSVIFSLILIRNASSVT